MACSWSVSPLATARPPPAAIRAYARAMSVLPTIELSSSRNSVLLKSGVSPLRCCSCVSCRKDASVCASTPALRISPTARCVGPSPTTRGRSLSGSMFTADITARNCVVLPTPAYPCTTVKRSDVSSIIRVAARCPDVSVSMSSPGTLSISGVTASLPSRIWRRMLFSASYDARETSRPVP